MGRIALIVGSVLLSTSAFAQPAEPEAAPPEQPPVTKDPKLAKKWLQAGDKLMAKGDQLTKQGKEASTQYTNAVTAYQKAVEASDDLTILYQLAVALDKSGNTPDAMKQLKRLTVTTGMKPDIVKKAQTKLDELSMKVGILTLQITPEGTQVSLAGKPIGEAPLAEPLVLPPGTHKVTFTAGGYHPKDVDFKIEAGSESERKIALEPMPVVNKPVEVEPPAPEPTSPVEPSLVPIYIGGGITVGLALIASVTGVIAVSEHSTFTDPEATPTERDSARSSGKSFALVTDFCLVGMVGAAAFTTYWYMFKYKPQSERSQAKVGLAPWVQSEAGGIVAVGSF